MEVSTMSIRNKTLVSISTILACCFLANGQETLRAYSDKIGLNIGTCTGGRMWRNGEANYVNTLKREFNTIVAENEMKASALQPNKGQFSFSTADDMVKFAEENNMKLRGHALVWHAQNPGWIQNGTWNRQTLLETMKGHINGVLTHFKAKNKTVFQWDVVNEAFHNDASSSAYRSSFWKNTIGEDFIDSAFTYAHRADPDVILFYNDYNTSNVNAKSTAMYNKIKKMLDNGVPIHGVGFQSHQTLEEYTPAFIASMKENFDRFAALGLQIAVTELDIRIKTPTDQAELTKQGEYYREYLETCLATPACRTFMIWGFTDKHSWIPGTFPGTGDGLIFNSSYQPKPAYTALLDVVKNFKIVSILPQDKSQRTSDLNLNIMSNNSYTDIFNLQGVKVGSYSIVQNPSLTDKSSRLANQAVISKDGYRRVIVQQKK
jgi:endo-1,4-beta-xylanase